jgi:SAM-dependent methyltransferase
MFSKNRDFWDAQSAEYQQAHGADLTARPLAWGVWRIPESEVGAVGDLTGRRVLELGCGAAQWTVALRQQGIDVVGLDVSSRQLAAARSNAAAAPVAAPLVQASAEDLPFADATFDVIFCDHGAMSFAEPERAVPEVARVLRDDGLFVFCMTTPLRDICTDPITGAFTGTLDIDYFFLGPFDDGACVSAQLPYGAWIRLFRRHSLIVEDLIELQAPPDALTTYVDYVSAEWAARWPAEHIWKTRRGHRT